MMTDEELGAIRARAEAAYRWWWRDRTQYGPLSDAAEHLAQGYRQDVPALLAEVGRLRERVAALEAERAAASANVQRLLERDAALRVIGEQVAEIKPWNCVWFDCDRADVPGGEDAHAPTCPVTKARALLAEEPSA